MLIGILFLFFGLSGGEALRFYPAYIALGVLCIARSIWIYQARWRHYKHNELRMTQTIQVRKRPSSD